VVALDMRGDAASEYLESGRELVELGVKPIEEGRDLGRVGTPR
jgi:hypothetical protein